MAVATTTASDVPTTNLDPIRSTEATVEKSLESKDIAGKDAGKDTGNISQPTSPNVDRRMSREWDASKVPPSQFQKRKGSIFATPGGRDGHVQNGQDRDKAFHAKLKEKAFKILGKKL